MKQKTKEIQIQNIPLQEQKKEYQLILWDICLALVLMTGSLISFVESWGQKTGMGILIAVTAGIGLLGSVLAQQYGKKTSIKGILYGIPWLLLLIVTGFHGYLTGFLSWINAIITGWNLSQEGGVALFNVQTTEQNVQAFSLVMALVLGEGILVLVKKKQRIVCMVMVTVWIVIQLVGATYNPVACGFLLAGLCGMWIAGRKTWITKSMVVWALGIAVLLCAVGMISDRASMETVMDFREQVEEKVHEIRYGKDTLPEGDLHQAGKLHASTEVMLEVQGQQEKNLYLRGFVGGSYQNGQWEEMSDAAYSGKNAGMFTWLKARSFDPLTQVAAYNQLGEEQDVPEGNQVQVKVKNASRYYVYAPVSYVRMINGSVQEEKDSRLASRGLFGSRSYRWEEISGSRPGELTVADNWVEDPDTDRRREYQEAEAVYREFVYHTYTTIDSDMQRLMQRIFWDDYETDSDGIYSALNQIRQCLSSETTYTEMMPQIPEGEDPIRWFLTEGKQGNDVYYAAAATEAFRAYGIPARYVEGYYLSADQIQKEESGTNTLTGADAHAWVEVYFDGVGWLPLDTTPGYYYDAVSLQQMISAPDQVNKNAVLEDPSFEANQATDTTGSRRNGDALKRVAVRMGAVILGSVTLLIILALVLLGVLEIGRIWDYESMHRKYERVDQKEKIHMMSEKMEKLLEFLGISMSLGWKTGEVDEKIHEKYPGVEAGSYLRVCRIMEKSLYGQMELEADEMRTIDSFMEKLQEIGKETLDRKGRILLRYGYVARIIGKIRRKTGQKRKNKKNDRKELTK